MTVPDPLRWLKWVGVALAGAAPLPAPAAASQPSRALSLRRVARSFSYAREGAWTQRTVRLANRSEAPRRLKVALVALDGQRGRTYFSAVAGVPAGTDRLVRVGFRPGRLGAAPAPGAPARGKGPRMVEETFLLWDARSGEQIEKGHRPAAVIEPRTTTIAIVAPGRGDWGGYGYLKGLPSRQLGQVQILGCDPRHLPDRWYGYSMVKVLVLGELDPASLRRTQVAAMLDWTGRGGVLVLAGGTALPETLKGPLARAAGAVALGAHHVRSLNVTGPDQHPLPEVRLDRPAPLAEILADRAAVVYHADHLALLAERPYGHGRIFTLALPLGALSPRPLHALWGRIGRATRTTPPVDDGRFAEAAPRALAAIAGRPAPPRTAAAMILVALGAGALLGGALLRRRRRGEILWACLVPLAVLAAAGMYVYGRSRSQPERLSYVGLLSGMGGGAAKVQEVFAYYSPARREVKFSAGGPRGVIRRIGPTAAGALGAAETRSDATMFLPGEVVEMNSTRLFLVDSVEPTAGLGCRFTFDASGLTGTVRNHLGAELADAVVHSNRRTYRLGNIPPSAATRLRAGTEDLLAAGEFTGSLVHTPADALRNGLLGRLRARPAMGREARREPVLIGYARRSPLDPLGGRDVGRRGWCVVVWPVALSPPPTGSRVTIPAGFVRLKLKNLGTPVWDVTGERFLRTFRDAGLVAVARPPPEVGPLRQVRAHLRIGIRARSRRLTVWAEPPTGGPPARRVRIGQFDAPHGVLRLTAPDADRFRRPDGGYAFSLEVRRLGGRRGGRADLENPAAWTFESVDIVLEGTTR